MAYADQMPPQVLSLPLSLVLASAAFGILTMLLFRMASNPASILRAKRAVQAQLLALRLFGDEPALVWQAQGRLLTANLRYIGAMLAPIIAAAIPFLIAFPQLEALYGRAPVPVGGETVLTLRLSKPFPDPLPLPRLITPAGLRVETPGVRVRGAGEVSWRLQAGGPVSEPVQIEWRDGTVSKSVQVGTGRGYLAETRPANLLAWLASPGEAPIDNPKIESIHVAYRGLRFSALGLQWPWEAWFITIAFLLWFVGQAILPAAF
jgi:hypothetical protein